jgi:hypothetical protein
MTFNDVNLVSVDLATQQGSGDASIGYFQPYYQYFQPYYVPPPNVYTYIYPLLPPVPRCAWCQGQHVGKCARLKSVTYRDDGTVQRVEFFEEEEGEHED